MTSITVYNPDLNYQSNNISSRKLKAEIDAYENPRHYYDAAMLLVSENVSSR
jgi:hypothetical protein